MTLCLTPPPGPRPPIRATIPGGIFPGNLPGIFPHRPVLLVPRGMTVRRRGRLNGRGDASRGARPPLLTPPRPVSIVVPRGPRLGAPARGRNTSLEEPLPTPPPPRGRRRKDRAGRAPLARGPAARGRPLTLLRPPRAPPRVDLRKRLRPAPPREDPAFPPPAATRNHRRRRTKSPSCRGRHGAPCSLHPLAPPAPAARAAQIVPVVFGNSDKSPPTLLKISDRRGSPDVALLPPGPQKSYAANLPTRPRPSRDAAHTDPLASARGDGLLTAPATRVAARPRARAENRGSQNEILTRDDVTIAVADAGPAIEFFALLGFRKDHVATPYPYATPTAHCPWAWTSAV